jgi:hypothetical protein
MNPGHMGGFLDVVTKGKEIVFCKTDTEKIAICLRRKTEKI